MLYELLVFQKFAKIIINLVLRPSRLTLNKRDWEEKAGFWYEFSIEKFVLIDGHVHKNSFLSN